MMSEKVLVSFICVQEQRCSQDKTKVYSQLNKPHHFKVGTILPMTTERHWVV